MKAQTFVMVRIWKRAALILQQWELTDGIEVFVCGR